MLSRRRFIQAGTMASGAALATRPAFAEEKCAPLPPSIAGLKSMKDHAMPITRDERRDREEKARRLMQASNLDAILLMEGTSLSYFTGIQWHGGKGGAFHEQDGVEVTCLHQSSSFLLAIPSFVSSDRGGLILHGFQPRNGRRQRRALLLCKSGTCGECCATGHCSSLNEATS